ncbi:imidazole glycerol phosphate synthase subunit HisH [Sphingomonas koreensis]|uniref:Imidazole glycerol phosphate synthase subunit HisH n=1 Tax=Sphingomonas koreensis TaxID=93064 RepID=A0A2M8WFV7_9SPHN|nr:imidazole glycerol phosphate synthase subunit HisH [Sphingomonas koreensis]PJI89804.1 glutamine amidotransferase [Sphingomonas koreensis]RSU61917.1 imidazole glycerol phosphate synthase subunit HisH [Sphingomonas koreensis]RSU70571.1 imidazole glycerol phosphate synthase subunit HisH [Sphingomonas koreensis]RSY81960.1 imidazole glycerol phosphate synthase subunit HisH [Sphingomonas koreensis]
MITIADYGLGNIRAFVNIYKKLNIDVAVAQTAAELELASRIILPGVGAFDWAMARLNASGLRDTLDELVLGRKLPVFGVCVGMQMMCKRSDEGELPGLGWLDAEVVRFDVGEGSRQGLQLPHMGWNDVAPVATDSLFEGLDDWRCYFLHSYYVRPIDPAITLAQTNYGGLFTSAVRSGNVCATQFHPEKSHGWGVALLRNFAVN